MCSADRLPASAEGVEVHLKLVRAHAATVVGDQASIYAQVLDSLPLDAVFNPRRFCFLCVLEGLAHPLINAALTIRALNKVVSARRLHRQEVLMEFHFCPLHPRAKPLAVTCRAR